MAYNARVYEVMIASPGDVQEERGIVRRAIHQWNDVHSKDRKLVLQPVGWETHASPTMGERPQEIINRQILRDCDLLIATFWTRIGSPTGKSPSGTVEEIEEHLSSGRPAMIYFSSRPVRPDSVDEAQYAALKSFKADCQRRGLVEFYDSIEEFKDKLARNLSQTVIRHFVGKVETKDEELQNSPHSIVGTLSERARSILQEAVLDSYGSILTGRTSDGLHLVTNGREFSESRIPSEEVQWEEALDELESAGLIKARNLKREVFAVTAKGFEVADLLANEEAA